MKRAQIQIDEEVYELLRLRAFREKKSIAGIIREILKRDTSGADEHPSPSIESFTFIGLGQSHQDPIKPVSEQHDEALREVFKK